MAERVAYLEAVFGADVTAFRRGTTQVRREMGLLSDTAGGLSRVGRNMTLMVTVPLIAAGTAAAALAVQFDAAMRNVNSILFENEENFQALSAATLEWGQSIRSGPVEAANALYTVVSAGFIRMDDAMRVATVATKTAEAGLADLSTTAEALSAAMLAYGADTNDAAHFGDVLTRTVQVGVGEMQEFATGIGNATASANMLGVSFHDLGATQAFLTQRGLRASKAATMLNRAFEKLISPTDEMDAAFQQLGVTTGRELIAQFGGLEGALGALQGVVGDDSEALRELFNTTQAFKAVGPIMNNFTAYSASMDDFRKAVDGAMDAAHGEQMLSWAAQFDLLTSALQAAGISIGNVFMPAVMPMVNTVREAFLAFMSLNPEVVALGAAAAGAVAAVGPLLWIMGGLLNPIGLVVGAIAALAGAFALDMGGVRDAVSQTVADITGDLAPLFAAVTDFMGLIMGQGETQPFVLTDAMFQVDPSLGAAVSVEITKTLWDAWVDAGGEGALGAWSAFRTKFDEVTGRDPLTLQAGEVFEWGGVSQISEDLRPMLEREMRLVEQDLAAASTIGDRLARAWTLQGPSIKAGITTLGRNMLAWLNTTLNYVLARATDFMIYTDGGGIYNAIKGLFEVDFRTMGKDVAAWFSQNMPGLGSGLKMAISMLGPFLEEVVVPEAAKVGGFLAGKLAVALSEGLGRGIRMIGALIMGAPGGVQIFGRSIVTPFQEGFAEAVEGSSLDSALTPVWASIAGLIAVSMGAYFIAPKFAMLFASTAGPLLAKGLGIAVTRALSAVTGLTITTSTLGPMIGTAISAGFVGLASGIVVVLGAISIATIGAIIFSQDARDNIQTATRKFLESTFGQEATDFFSTWDAGVDDAFNTLITQSVGSDLALSANLNLSNFGTTGDIAFLDAAVVAFTNFGTVMDMLDGREFGLFESINQFGLLGEGGLEGEFTAIEASLTELGALTDGLQQSLAPGNFTPLPTAMWPEDEAARMQSDMVLMSEMMTEGGPIPSGFLGVELSATEAKSAIVSGMTAANEKLVVVRDTASNAAGKLAAMAGTYIITIITRHLSEGSPAGPPGAGSDGGGGGGGANRPRAGGGGVRPGGAYLVGEQGPELLQMGSRAGNIISNDDMRGGGVTHNQISIQGVQNVDMLLYELERRGIYLES